MAGVLVVRAMFVPESESEDGSGWRLDWAQDGGDMPDGTSTENTVEWFETITDLQTRIDELFSGDPLVHAYWVQRAEENVLAANAADVATEVETLRVAEGLTAEPTP